MLVSARTATLIRKRPCSYRKHVPATIGSILSKTQKEKVVRVAVLTIRNILEQSKPDVIKTNVENMVANKLLRSIRGIQVRRGQYGRWQWSKRQLIVEASRSASYSNIIYSTLSRLV